MGTKIDRHQHYRDALARIPPPGVGAGCHPFLLAVANHGIMAGIPAQQLFDDIRRAIPRGKRRVPDSDIRSTIRRASRDQENRPRSTDQLSPTRPCRSAPALDGPAYRGKLVEAARGSGKAELWHLSPVRFDWPPGVRDALTLLNALYMPEEFLYIGDKYGREVATVTEWMRRLSQSSLANRPHVIPNPLDGQAHPTAEGRLSFRGNAAVAAFRFVLVEFDDAPLEEQFAFWVSVLERQLLPVAAIIHSGGKSLHAWLRVDLPSRGEWDYTVRGELYGQEGRLTRLGADRACCNPARASRLPGHVRRETGRAQELLYLNPNLPN